MSQKEINEIRRLLAKTSIVKLAKQLGVSRQTIYNWLKGTHGFTLKNYEKLKKVINK